MPSKHPIDVVGGVYIEHCLRPTWNEVYGSAGRAASAIALLGGEVHLHAYLDQGTEAAIRERAILEGFEVRPTRIDHAVVFDYSHGLATPDIHIPTPNQDPIVVKTDNVVRYGQLEGDAVIQCERAVYDPQNVRNPRHFHENGSQCDELALILNQQEAQALLGKPVADPEQLSRQVRQAANASVVVIKRGAWGAVVLHDDKIAHVPAYSTQSVWKIGSGDTFVAHFTHRWIAEGRSPAESADLASRATAYYCQTKGLPSSSNLDSFDCRPIQPKKDPSDCHRPLVYLAGPFFNLPELWMVEQARRSLLDLGLKVFSPYHDVGLGSAADVAKEDLHGLDECDLVFALLDGLDSGTLFEIGYARSKNIPVIAYAEKIDSEDQKMLVGTDCEIFDDFVTAIYKSHWKMIS